VRRTGPEALLMASAIAAQRDLCEFTRSEYSLAEAPRVQATLLQQFEATPTKRSLSWKILRRRGKLLGGVKTGLKARRSESSGIMAAAPVGRAESTGSLAALPALSGSFEGGASPLSATLFMEGA
jgi:hypothetical protein